jgi:hypothetical protein
MHAIAPTLSISLTSKLAGVDLGSMVLVWVSHSQIATLWSLYLFPIQEVGTRARLIYMLELPVHFMCLDG